MIREVERPACISMYFDGCGKIDQHNQARQGFLRLEKHWTTQSGWFRVFTTLVGITVTDAWLCMRSGLGSDNPLRNVSIIKFAGILAKQLRDKRWSTELIPGVFIRRPEQAYPEEISMISEDDVVSPMGSTHSGSVRSSVFTSLGSLSSSSVCVCVPTGAPFVEEEYREKHRRLKITGPRKKCKDPRCRALTKKQKTPMSCTLCNQTFCADETGRFCFYAHICQHYIATKNPSAQFKMAYNKWNDQVRNVVFDMLEKRSAGLSHD
jgi:hypothetical protein